MSSSCLESNTNIRYITYLQRECFVPLIAIRRQRPWIFWRNRSLEFSPHWSLCSRVHTTNSLQWVRVAVCREHDVPISRLRKYGYRPATEQGEFQVRRAHQLHILLLNIGARTQPWGTSAAVFLGIENLPFSDFSILSVIKKQIL
jgi:hypothetical protein